MRPRSISILILLLIGCWAAYAQKTVDVATPAACLVQLKGDVQMCPAGGAWGPARANEVLPAGSEIKTGAGAVATMMLWDKSTIKLSQNAHIRIVDLTETEDSNFVRKFQLKAGKLWMDVTPSSKGKFEVETQYATASVKGTSFELEFEDDEVGVQVFEGQVDLSADNAVEAVHADEVVTFDRKNRFQRGRFDRRKVNEWQRRNLMHRDKLRTMLKNHPRLDFRRLKAEHREELKKLFQDMTPDERRRLKKHMQQPRPGNHRPPRRRR